ncbi:MAG: hypothetical protein M1434_08630 [Chloroflexi bacterium]|nr:hypothetical protein [Chloroflexota bacterium]MCL5274794.1 hypothetical protein [Chloroflexota bacterium]
MIRLNLDIRRTAQVLTVTAIGVFFGVIAVARTVEADTIVPAGTLTNTIWTTAGSPYIVNGFVYAGSGYTLTIQPGVEVRFNSGTELVVQNNAILSAEGTMTQPITFTANLTNPAPGTWRSLYFQTGSTAYLRYCDVAYGGMASSVLYALSPNLSVRDCRIHDNLGDAVYLGSGTPVASMSNLLIDHNSGAAIHMTTLNITPPFSGLRFNGNGQDAVVVPDTTVSRDTVMDGSPAALGGAPFVLGYVYVSAGYTLTIAPGTQLRFDSYKFLQVLANGRLSAIGTPSQPITFTANMTNSVPVFWRFLYFGYNSIADLRYCDISEAGNSGFASLYIYSPDIRVRDCRIHDNLGDAVYLDSGTPVASMSNLLIDHNSGAAIHMTTLNITPPFSGLRFNGNGQDAVVVPDTTVNRDTVMDGSPAALGGAPFVLGHVYVSAGYTLTIAPGTQLRFDSDKLLQVNANGRLSAIGTPSQPITFTANMTNSVPVFWRFLYFGYNSSADLRYCDISEAGHSGFASLYIYSPYTRVRDCRIHDNAGGGVQVNIASGGAYLFSPNQVYNNAYGLYNMGAIQVDARDTWWGDASGPYHPWQNPTGHGNSVSDNVLFIPWLLQPYGGAALLTPNQGSNQGSVTVMVKGLPFTSGASINLVRNGQLIVRGNIAQVDPDGALFASFNLNGTQPITYDVVLSDTGSVSVTLTGGFTVITGTLGRIEYSLSNSAIVRPNRAGYILLNYRNAGDTDVTAPMLIISGTNTLLRLPEQSSPRPDNLAVLGIAGEGPVGVLPPGRTNSLSVIVLPKVASLGSWHTFTLQLPPAVDTPLDWNSIKADVKPFAMPSAAWDVTFANYTATVGQTYGALNQSLADAADYLNGLGIRTADAARLMGFGINIAGDYGAIARHYASGAYGVGTPDATDYVAIADANGNVTIRKEGRVRGFLLQANGSYKGAPGDGATLTYSSGAYRMREGNGQIIQFQPDGRFAYAQDTNGNRSTAVYAGVTLAAITYTNGVSVAYAYDGLGRVVQMQDSRGGTASYTYDAQGHLSTRTANSMTITYGWSPETSGLKANSMVSMSLPTGEQILWDYDANGRVKTQSATAGAVFTYTYGAHGEVTVTNSGGGMMSYLLDDAQRPWVVSDAGGQQVRITYDSHGNLLSASDHTGILASNGYDVHDNLVRVTDQLNRTITATHELLLNRMTSAADPRHQAVTFGHDARGNLTAMQQSDGSSTLFGYDAGGDMTQFTNRRAQVFGLGYDSSQQLTGITGADNVTYTYDTHGNVIGATSATGSISFTYSPNGNITQVTYPNGRYLSYGYDASNRRNSVVAQDGYSLGYDYDAGGNLSGIRGINGQRVVTYTYDALERLTKVDRTNGATTIYRYDLYNRVEGITHTSFISGVIEFFNYAYDSRGRRVSVTSSGGTTTYGYDLAGQLISITLPGGHSLQYTYDVAGNRLTSSDNAVTSVYTTNALNQYVAAGSATLAYDADGNVLTKTISGQPWTYAYDTQGRLTAMASPTETWTFEYDAIGNRSAMTHNGNRTEYLVDPFGMGYAFAEYDGAGQVLAHYISGNGIVARVEPTDILRYYHYDGAGNTVRLTNPNGSVANSYHYLPFGEIDAKSETVTNPLHFLGAAAVMDAGDNLPYVRVRNYDPALGRFTSPDVVYQPGRNAYEYAGNSPIDRVDTNGMFGLSSLLGFPFNPLSPFDPGMSLNDNLGLEAQGAQDFANGMLEMNQNNLTSQFQNASKAYKSGNNFINAERQMQQLGKGITQNSKLAGGLNTVGGLATLYSLSDLYDRYQNGEADIWDVSNGLGLATASLASNGPGAFKILKFAPYIDYGSKAAFNSIYNWWYQPNDDVFADPARAQWFRDHQRKGPQGYMRQLKSADPNELVGPAGYGLQAFVAVSQTLPYVIFFENIPTATLPAQTVVVTQQLDANLDLAGFELGDISFGKYYVSVPAGLSSYSTRVDARDTVNLYVDVTATLDSGTRVVTWVLDSIDPTTGQPTADPAAGFLPPDVVPPQGLGVLSYRVLPAATSQTGAVISATARITFDANEPIDTNVFTNTVDAHAPASTVSLLQVQSHPTFNVDWSGDDDAGGSGLAAYDILASVDGGPFVLWKEGTTLHSAAFTGVLYHTYSFYSVAVDNAGNQQPNPSSAQTSTTTMPWIVYMPVIRK